MSSSGGGKADGTGVPESKKSDAARPAARPAKPAAAGARPPAAPARGEATAKPPARPPAPGSKSADQQRLQIGPYRIMQQIGAGGMGTVYRAVHIELDREVALKILPSKLAANPTMVARFKREAKAAAQLQHENIVQIYDVSEEKGVHYLALEFVRGTDLHDLITKKKHLSLKDTIDYLKQATRALNHAFSKGIVHRDIKPSNFLITTEGGRVKLCDMGLALRTDAGDEAKITRDGSTVGTVDYMAPEQARDSRLADTRSDIYSLGCTFYHMLTGRVPFEEGTIPEKLFKHATEPPPDPLQYNPDIPKPVVYVLMRMLEKKAEDRYQTPAELLAELEALELDEKPQEAELKALAIGAEADEAEETLMLQRRRDTQEKQRQTEAQKRRQQWLMIGGAAAAALLLITVTTVLLMSGGSEPDKKKQVAKTGGTGVGSVQNTAGVPLPPPVKPGSTAVPVMSSTSGSGTTPGVAAKPEAEPTGSVPVKPESGTTQPAVATSGGSGTDATTPGGTPEAVPAKPAAKPTVNAGDVVAAKKAYGTTIEPRLVVAGTVEVGRVPGDQRNIYSSLSAACKQSQTQGSLLVIADNGPLFERSFIVQDRDIEIGPKPEASRNYRPLVVIDPAPTGGQARSFFVQAKNCDMRITGVDFVLPADDLAAISSTGKYSIFEVTGGDLVFQDCTFTVLGKHAGEISIVTLLGLRDEDPARAPKARLAQLVFRNCYVRGTIATRLATVACGVADVEVAESLVVVDRGPVFDLQAPQGMTVSVPLSRSVRSLGSTFLSRGDFVSLVGGPQKAIATEFKFVDTIVAANGAGNKRLVRATDWTESAGRLAEVKWTEGATLYAGWDTLASVGIPAKILADNAAKWQQLWGLEAGSQEFRKDTWPAGDLGDLASIAAGRFDASELAAGIASRLGEPTIGCQVARLRAERPLWKERVVGPIELPSLIGTSQLFPSQTLDSGNNPLFSAWTSAQDRRRRAQPAELAADDQLDPVFIGEQPFNADQGDLGKYLAELAKRPESVIVLKVQGASRSRPMSPVKIERKSLVLWFDAKGSPVMQPVAGGGSADALIDVRNGDLIIENADFSYPAATAGLPPRLLQVINGNLTLARCRLYGPIFSDPKTANPAYRELIHYVGGVQRTGGPPPLRLASGQTPDGQAPVHLDFHPAPNDKVAVCQFIDCLLSSSVRCLTAQLPSGIVRFQNCVGVSPDVFLRLNLEDARAESFDSTVWLERNTIAASRTFLQVGRWQPRRPADRPLTLLSSDNLFCDPFDFAVGAESRKRTAVFLRYDSPTLEQGMLQWHSANDAFTKDIHSFVLRDTLPPGQTQKLSLDWLPLWGRRHVEKCLSDETSGRDKIRLRAGTSVRLREFTQKDLANLTVLPNCEAATHAADNGPVGADLSRSPFFVTPPRKSG